MAFDYKKELREFYMPKNKPGIVTVPSMNFIAVRGQGDPNEGGRRIQAVDRIAVFDRVYDKNEQKGQPRDRRLF